MDQQEQAIGPQSSDTDKLLANTVRSLDQLDELGLEGVEPATVFVVTSDGG